MLTSDSSSNSAPNQRKCLGRHFGCQVGVLGARRGEQMFLNSCLSQGGCPHYQTWQWKNDGVRILNVWLTPPVLPSCRCRVRGPDPRDPRESSGLLHSPWAQAHDLSGFALSSSVYQSHLIGKFCWWCFSLYSSGRLCSSWTICMMCFRLCLNDVFLQPQSETFRWFVPYFDIFRNSWLIDWIFNFSQRCLMLGRLCPLSPLRTEKICIKFLFP